MCPKIAKSSIRLIIVMGAPLSGKSTWCKDQQVLLPNTFVIPYDDMLFSMRQHPLVNKTIQTVVANGVYDIVWGLSALSSNINIIVDGFPMDLDMIEKFAQITDHFMIVRTVAKNSTITHRNEVNRKAGRYYWNKYLGQSQYDMSKFLSSETLHDLLDMYDADFTTIDPLKKISVIESIENSVNQYAV